MSTFSIIFGIIVGLAFGISFASLFVIRLVKKSNDIGDSKGHFSDFGEKLDVISHDDNFYNVY